MTRRLVMVLIPIGIFPLRGLDVSTRTGFLGRRIPCHCLSVLALMVRLIAVKTSLVDTYRAPLYRHRCQSSINTVTRRRAQAACSTSGRVVCRIAS
jgi:hypothetical protein